MKFYNESFEDEIRGKAREIYELSGRVAGRDLDDWIAAEQIVFDQHAESVSQEDGDGSFSDMPFEGSEW